MRQSLLQDEIPEIMRRRLDCLPAEDRAAVEQDLRELVLGYTGQVFRTIREASLCLSEERCTREP